MNGMMNDEMEGGGMMGAGPPAANEGETETPSIFLTKAALGGKTFKEGDTLTLTVRDVDPETGDVQADLAGSGGGKMEGGMMAAFNEAMPEEME